MSSETEPVAMHELRKTEIRYAVIKSSDVLSLARLVTTAAERVQGGRGSGATFLLEAANGREFSTSSLARLEAADSPLDRVWIHTFKADFYSSEPKAAIRVVVTHGDKGLFSGIQNKVEVAGDDPHWVSATMGTFEDEIAGFEPQRRLSGWQRWILFLLMTVSIMVMSLAIGVPLVQLTIARPDENDAVSVILGLTAILSFTLGLLGSLVIPYSALLKIDKLWPFVELRTGRDYMNVEARRRRQVGYILAVGVLPLVISILAGVLLLPLTD